jgi:hypothetical protein
VLAHGVHGGIVGRIGDGDESRAAREAVRDRLVPAGDRLGQLVDRLVGEVELGEVDVVELLLLGEESRKVGLADPAVGEHDLAQAPVGLLRLDQGVAHGGRARDPIAHDQASERQIPQVHDDAFRF